MCTPSILVVDDDENVRSSLAMILQKAGFRVLTTGLGQSALHMICREHLDMVLLDLSLPDIHGLSLLPKIQTKHSDLPVIILTATPTPDTIAEASRLKIQGYLLKPLDPDILVERVRSVLCGHPN